MTVTVRVAVRPLAISHMPKSDDFSVFELSTSSEQMNSQHELPIENDLQFCGGVHSTALHALAWPLSQIHKRHISGPGT